MTVGRATELWAWYLVTIEDFTRKLSAWRDERGFTMPTTLSAAERDLCSRQEEARMHDLLAAANEEGVRREDLRTAEEDVRSMMQREGEGIAALRRIAKPPATPT